MSDQTTRITKDRLQYLEYLEANASFIVNNAVIEIIEREKQKKKHTKPKTASSTLYMSSIAHLDESRS